MPSQSGPSSLKPGPIRSESHPKSRRFIGNRPSSSCYPRRNLSRPCNKPGGPTLNTLDGRTCVWPKEKSKNFSMETCAMKRFTKIAVSALFVLTLTVALAPAAFAKGNGGGSGKSCSSSSCHSSCSHDSCHDYCYHDYCCNDYCYPTYCQPTYCQPPVVVLEQPVCQPEICVQPTVPCYTNYCTPSCYLRAATRTTARSRTAPAIVASRRTSAA